MRNFWNYAPIIVGFPFFFLGMLTCIIFLVIVAGWATVWEFVGEQAI